MINDGSAAACTGKCLEADIGSHVVIAVAVGLGCSAVFVVLKLYSRMLLTKRAGSDDALIVISFCAAVAMSAMLIQERKHGLGRHRLALTLEEGEQLLKYFWASIPAYAMALAFAKISMAVNYIRIFNTSYTLTKWSCWALLVVVICQGIISLFAGIFICYPVQAFWLHDLQGRCVDTKVLWFYNSAINMVTDFALFLVPIPAVMALNLPRRQKRSVMLAFGLGLAACICTIVRLYFLANIIDSTDPSWDNVGAAIASSVEVNISIVCACFPTMKPLLVKLVPNFLTNSNHRSDARHTITNDSGREASCMEEQRNTNSSRLYRLKRLQPSRWSSTPSTPSTKPNQGTQNIDLERGRTFSIEEENAHDLQHSDKFSTAESDISHPNPFPAESTDSRSNKHSSTEVMLPPNQAYFHLRDSCFLTPVSANTSRSDPDAVSITESEKELFGVYTPRP